MTIRKVLGFIDRNVVEAKPWEHTEYHMMVMVFKGLVFLLAATVMMDYPTIQQSSTANQVGWVIILTVVLYDWMRPHLEYSHGQMEDNNDE